MKVPPVFQAVLAGFVAWAISRFSPLVEFSGVVAGVASATVGIAGVTCLLSAVRLFQRKQTTVNPLEPSKAERLVVDGLYRVTRNPMYVGMALLLVGWCLHLGTLSAFISVPVFVFAMNELQIKPEERALTDKFGEQYQAYCGQVRRWV